MELDINAVITKAVDQAIAENPDVDREDLQRTLHEILDKDKLPYEAMEVDKELVDYFYSLGYHAYQAGKYEDALEAFHLIRTLDPSNTDVILGKALAYKELRRYHDAIAQFYFYAGLNPDDPQPFWHIYECFDALNDLSGAGTALGAVIYICGEVGGYDDLLQKARSSLDKITNEEIAEKQNKGETK